MLAGDHIDQATKQNKLRPVRRCSYSFLVLPLIVHYCDRTWQFPWSSFSPSNICLKEQFDSFGKFTYCHKLHSPISRYKSLSLSAPVCVWSTCIKSKTTFFGKPPGGVTQWHLRWCRSYKLGFDSNNIQQTYCFSNRNSNSNHANECSKHCNRLENSCQNAVLFFSLCGERWGHNLSWEWFWNCWILYWRSLPAFMSYEVSGLLTVYMSTWCN